MLQYNLEDLSRKNCRNEVRQYCELQSCRRDFICQHFGTTSHFYGNKHDCCDNCANDCTCGLCGDLLTSQIPDLFLLDYDSDTASTIQEILLQLFNVINSGVHSAIDPALLTGLTNELALDIAENYHLMVDFDVMVTNYFYIQTDYIEMRHEAIMQYHLVWLKLALTINLSRCWKTLLVSVLHWQ